MMISSTKTSSAVAASRVPLIDSKTSIASAAKPGRHRSSRSGGPAEGRRPPPARRRRRASRCLPRPWSRTGPRSAPWCDPARRSGAADPAVATSPSSSRSSAINARSARRQPPLAPVDDDGGETLAGGELLDALEDLYRLGAARQVIDVAILLRVGVLVEDVDRIQAEEDEEPGAGDEPLGPRAAGERQYGAHRAVLPGQPDSAADTIDRMSSGEHAETTFGEGPRDPEELEAAPWRRRPSSLPRPGSARSI